MQRDTLLSIVAESLRLKKTFFEQQADSILDVGRLLAEALGGGNKALVFGNGGSAADAQHFSAELVNRFRVDRPGLGAIALTTDTSILTSIANDTDFEKVFGRQIEALGTPGDVAFAISTSGNSANVLEGARVARDMGLRTVGLSGRDGGELASMVDVCFTVPHRETSRIQEVHGMLIHFFCQIVEDTLYPNEGS